MDRGEQQRLGFRRHPELVQHTTQLADYFYINDLATFDDSAGSTAGNVTISGTGVYPAA